MQKGTANWGILYKAITIYNSLISDYINCVLVSWCLLMVSNNELDHSIYKWDWRATRTILFW